MKSLITLILTLLLATLGFAQNGINYKAIIKDNSGNVIANDLISVQFTILQGVDQTNVYQETHTPTTDANGLIIVNVGEGTLISGTFATIDWASDTTFLNTKINTGSGMVDMGTTEFKTVPYAINAKTATVAANVTGLEALNEGNGIGWRLKGRNPSYYGSIGLSAVDLSYSSGSSFLNGAIGDYSISMGENTTASGQNSISMGENTYAPGQNSISMGFNTRASSYASVAIGKYNVGGGSASTWVSTDPIFEVGFGGYIGFPVNNIIRLNSFTILKNGNVGIGTSTPSTSLQIAVGDDASYSSDSGYLVLGSTNGSNLVFDQNEIIARNNGAASTLFLQQDGGDVRVGGVVVHSSDRRLKKDITSLTYGLETILELNPVEYNWKNREQDHKSLGLIAQEVQPILENIVHIADDEDKTLSVSYTELIPVLIKAIQEQQEIIKIQALKINGLTAEAEEKDKTLKAFDSRLKQMASVLNQTHQ
ncbi:tail fiber domain-containing protein [Winogradskyella thalassocola]|uniref:Head domain of trimeric autotransporter adhesin n=1 Tax=Winogradskyella thalassocola TaxID=262004 RepID=A0A1G8BKS4_9FLAO|nr:tail fiber domain-containing protein [Winogradskyella thalassocola]SDH33819.1 Head domain of trimeric autotransporter adhesin [Winogradskyella thalassocola]